MIRCMDVYRDNKARGCRLPLGHEGRCDATLPPAPRVVDLLDDPSDDHDRVCRERDDALADEEWFR